MKRLSQDHLVGLAANAFISAKVRSRTLHYFLLKAQIKEKDTHHTCIRYNTKDIYWLHHLGRRGPFHISLPRSGRDFPAVWKEMLSPCHQSRMFPQQATTRGAQLPPLPKGSQLSPQHRAVQTSQVSFSFMEEDAKSCWESPAQLTWEQGSKGAVLRFCHIRTRHQGLPSVCILWVWQMKPQWERHLKVLFFCCFLKREGFFIC